MEATGRGRRERYTVGSFEDSPVPPPNFGLVNTSSEHTESVEPLSVAPYWRTSDGATPVTTHYEYAMKICWACERDRPDGAYCEEQRGRRQSSRRCEECVAVGNHLVLMKKGRMRLEEEDDCPICRLPLPLEGKTSKFKVCCMTKVCNGCMLAARKRGMRDCPFCRTPTPKKSQVISMIQKRVDARDPVAIYHLGSQYYTGYHGLEKEVTRAVELYEHAAELGLKEAHHNLGCLYDIGTDVEKDTAKAVLHWEAAAVKGDVAARYNLGWEERAAGNHDLALQHWMISAKLGDQDSLDEVRNMFVDGLATKADYADALRGHQSAVEEMRSLDREEALALSKR